MACDSDNGCSGRWSHDEDVMLHHTGQQSSSFQGRSTNCFVMRGERKAPKGFFKCLLFLDEAGCLSSWRGRLEIYGVLLVHVRILQLSLCLYVALFQSTTTTAPWTREVVRCGGSIVELMVIVCMWGAKHKRVVSKYLIHRASNVRGLYQRQWLLR